MRSLRNFILIFASYRIISTPFHYPLIVCANCEQVLVNFKTPVFPGDNHGVRFDIQES